MVAFIAFFDKDFKGSEYTLRGQYMAHFTRAFPSGAKQLAEVKTCIAYFVGKENDGKPAYSLEIKKTDTSGEEIKLGLDKGKRLSVCSGVAAAHMRRLAKQNGWVNEDGLAPLICLLPQDDAAQAVKKMQANQKIQTLLDAKDYKNICMMYAPLGKAKQNPQVWDDADVLYALGLACSRLSVTLLVKAEEKERLASKAKYREFAVAFLERGAAIEADNARFATALAYRHYSNVHELTRPGERRDQNLETEIEKANEWLSKAIEMNPQSIRNHYRKGKLIIEKQAPYLLFGKQAFGKGEATLLREIRQVGEEHLATAISLYEALKDEKQREANRREYAKALFVLGKHYLGDANLPVYEFYAHKLSGGGEVKIEKISKMNLESAQGLLNKCFAAETDMSLGSIDVPALASQVKQWVRSPVDKLYLLGSVYCGAAFVEAAQGDEAKSEQHARKAISLLSSAKSVADKGEGRRRNTWHISEKIAQAHMHMGKYEKAASLLARAKAGYVVNTYALSLLLTGTEESAQKAQRALKPAAQNTKNLARTVSQILLAYAQKLGGKDAAVGAKDLSEKNRRLAEVLGVLQPES